MNFFEEVEQVNYLTFFGPEPEAARKKYLRYARALHPDMVPPHQAAKAQRAFAVLIQLWDQYKAKVDVPDNGKPDIIKTRKREYSIEKLLGENEVYQTNLVSFDAGNQHAELLAPLSPKDNDLMGNMATTLRQLKNDVPDQYQAFFPKFIEKLMIAQTDGNRAAVVVSHTEGMYSLDEVLKAYPQGLHGRDVAWMFRRMLVAVGNAADAGFVHAAVTPESVFVHPEQHGLILTQWQYAVKGGQSLVAIPGKRRDMYPTYALEKKPVNTSLDLSMCAKTSLMLMCDSGPKAMRAFFKGCQSERLPEAKYLLAEFDELLLRLYGKPSFHPFTMP